MIQYRITYFSGPGPPTGWNSGLNINVKPYLKNGSSTVFMQVVAVGGREGAIQPVARQLCSYDCYDQWDSSQCTLLEQRAQ